VTYRSLLLVEDNPFDEELVFRALRKCEMNPEVIVAHDGAEALDYLFATGAHAGRESALPPAVILLDLKLPKVDGHEVIRRIRADPRSSAIPVVILTSSKEDEDRLTGYSSGANSFIRKPIEFGEFCEAIRLLGAYWLVLNEPPPQRRRP
jgi:CheY-like chemotaxis protein